MPKQVILKLLKTGGNEKFLKTASQRKRTLYTENKGKTISRFIVRNKNKKKVEPTSLKY